MKFLKYLSLSFLLSSCISAPEYKGPQTDHFDGEFFHNRQPMNKTTWDILKFVVSMPFLKENWPDFINEIPQKLAKANPEGAVHVTFINHASFLLRYKGQTIITDPIFSDRASPFTWTGPKRVRPPGIEKESLPNIDVILISHNHYDHLDLESLKWLYENKGEPLILVGLGVGDLLKQNGMYNFIELDWDQSHTEKEIRYTFNECRHRSGRGLGDQMKTLWGAFVIETDKHKIYFAGDTGYDVHFKKASEKFGEFDLSLLPIGAYEPRWFMRDPHVNPEEAVQAHMDLRSKLSIGMHFATFQLTYEKIDQPEKDLKEALKKYGVDEKQFLIPGFGQSFHIP